MCSFVLTQRGSIAASFVFHGAQGHFVTTVTVTQREAKRDSCIYALSFFVDATKAIYLAPANTYSYLADFRKRHNNNRFGQKSNTLTEH